MLVLGVCGIGVNSDVGADSERPTALSAEGVSGPASAGSPATRVGNSSSTLPSTGRMVGTRVFDNTLLGVDLETGRFSALAGNAELAALGATRGDATVETRRDRGAESGMVLTVDDCLEERDETICVLFADRDGNVVDDDFFSLDGKFPGPVKTSFDGRFVVVERSDRAAGASFLSMFTRDGEFVSGHAQTAGLDSDGAYDWLPDGRLVFSIEGNELLGDPQPTGFFITDPYETTPRRRITLPDYYQEGRIKTIESSPDGRQVLMNVAPRVGPTRPILVDLETLTVTQLIDREDGSLIDAKSVVWGPSGRWVYVVVSTAELLSGVAADNSSGDVIVFIGFSDSLFAYRSDGSKHPMPLDQDDLSDSVRMIPTDSPTDPGGEVGGGEYDGKLVWIP